MVKIFKNLILQNLLFKDLETWHAALGTLALQRLYVMTGSTFAYFMARSNLIVMHLNGKSVSHIKWENLQQITN